jgi:carbon storage regulator
LKIETRRIKDMLVLSRKESEKIRLGEDVILTIVRVSGDRVRLGIQAPSNMLILREELNPEAVKETSKTSAVA